jgi:VanZ family protein
LSSRPHLRVASDDLVDLITRKSAHLLAFGMLLVIVERALRRAAQPQTTTIAIAWLVTLTWAAIDEYHQTFVPGRVGHTTDVMIDMVGASIAAAVLLWKRDRSEKGLP